MPWTTPETFTAGQTLTAASMNAISGNLDVLPRVVDSGTLTTSNISIASASSYAALEIILNMRSTAAATNDIVGVRLNGDTSGNYDYQYNYFSTVLNATAAVAQTAGRIGLITADNSTASFTSTYRLMLYSPGSSNYKTAVVTGGFTQTSAVFSANAFFQWRSTAVVTTISFGLATGPSFTAASNYTIIGHPVTA
jgi:hypothetical protein